MKQEERKRSLHSFKDTSKNSFNRLTMHFYIPTMAVMSIKKQGAIIAMLATKCSRRRRGQASCENCWHVVLIGWIDFLRTVLVKVMGIFCCCISLVRLPFVRALKEIDFKTSHVSLFSNSLATFLLLVKSTRRSRSAAFSFSRIKTNDITSLH